MCYFTQIVLKKNSMSSKWIDLEDLVASQDVDVVDAEGVPNPELFIEEMKKYRKKPTHKQSGKERP